MAKVKQTDEERAEKAREGMRRLRQRRKGDEEYRLQQVGRCRV